jgi:signal transduction histidine kinase
MSRASAQSQVNILLIDDTPDRLQLTEILVEQGYQVRAASTAKQALASTKRKLPNLILLDINLPEIDGYEICRQLKADQHTRSIPVIFLSAWNNGLDKAKAFAVGGADYITKPFQLEEVTARIKTHLTIGTLQNALDQSNEELTSSLKQLSTAQNQLVQAEKMASLGQLVANVTHEMNTPLGAIRSSAELINYSLSQNLESMVRALQTIAPEHRQLFFLLLQRSFEATPRLTGFSSREKRQFKRHLIQQLATRIADADVVADTLVDIGIHDTIEPFLELLSYPDGRMLLDVVYQLVSLQKSTRTILTATDRAARIALALKRYMYHDASGRKTETDIVEGIEIALTLHLNQLKRGVEVVRHYADVSSILGFPDELNQLWTNLLSNALQSMDYHGTLTITVSQTATDIRVDISDTGKGISPELQSRIFEPFFTTKPKGEGIGLGLSIVKQIVEHHGGRIELESRPGQTTFSIFLPLQAAVE